LSQEAILASGGPSVATQSAFESGTYARSPRHSTLRGYDSVLQWEPGSAARTYYGGDPQPVVFEPRHDVSTSGEQRPAAADQVTWPAARRMVAARLAKWDQAELEQMNELIDMLNEIREEKLRAKGD
jgi:hypothetical protein